ncbi:prephenate dehydrogenase [Haloarchaeobius sp. DFWS5]|uniref:prephenate dehydrogenase n=1 Tax=Haloarchaeobius sp. DFWS5 TaxID=3446114 RepID=UPI003EBE67C9
MQTLVVGAGAMGRWVGRTVPGDVAFADTDVAAAEAAADECDGRAVSLDSADGEDDEPTDERFDALCFAVPMGVVRAAIAEHAHRAERAVFDVTGTMETPVEAMREHAADCERVSFHPLFAPANAPGNVPLVADSPGPVTDRIREAMTEAGNRLFETTPAEHDEAMSTVQAKTHAAVLAFALAADEVDERFHTPISAGLDGLAAQVTGGDAHVYAGIQAAFDGADEVADAARRIADADEPTFEQLYREAGSPQAGSPLTDSTQTQTDDRDDDDTT